MSGAEKSLVRRFIDENLCKKFGNALGREKTYKHLTKHLDKTTDRLEKLLGLARPIYSPVFTFTYQEHNDKGGQQLSAQKQFVDRTEDTHATEKFFKSLRNGVCLCRLELYTPDGLEKLTTAWLGIVMNSRKGDFAFTAHVDKSDYPIDAMISFVINTYLPEGVEFQEIKTFDVYDMAWTTFLMYLYVKQGGDREVDINMASYNANEKWDIISNWMCLLKGS